MNQTQRTYIRKRVEGILLEKTAEARMKFTTQAKTITNHERVNLIRAGKVKLKPRTELAKLGAYNTNLSAVFDFSDYETNGHTDTAAVLKHTKKLRVKANEINDNVMLGDAVEALKMIKDFENFIV